MGISHLINKTTKEEILKSFYDNKDVPADIVVKSVCNYYLKKSDAEHHHIHGSLHEHFSGLLDKEIGGAKKEGNEKAVNYFSKQKGVYDRLAKEHFTKRDELIKETGGKPLKPIDANKFKNDPKNKDIVYSALGNANKG